MSKAEIQSWIAASEREDEDDASAAFQWNSLHEDWQTFVDFAIGHLLTGSTKMRTEFLEERLTPLAARGGMQNIERPALHS